MPVLVSSDAHRPHELAFLDFALSQARRAWLTKAQVLNTRTWPQIQKMMKR